MWTLPAPLVGECIQCRRCAGPVLDVSDAVALADTFFHQRCAPHCEICGRSLAAELEIYWSYEELVVSSAEGYERLPFHHVCDGCRDATLLDEPSAQD
jgi:hypothetical protein